MHSPPAPPLYRPRLGTDGDACAGCGAPLATDQRYCLECGERRADARLPFDVFLERAPDRAVAQTVVAPAAPRGTPGWAFAVMAVALMVIGASGGAVLAGELSKPSNSAATPPVVNVTAALPTPSPVAPADPAAAATATVTTTWPAGTEGWTISLRSLPKDTATAQQVEAALSEVRAAGATDAGVLDADQFASLEGGAYVVYSGVYDTRKAASAALKDIEAGLPDAKVVEVSSTAPTESSDAEQQSDEELKETESLSPEEAQEKIRKAPDEVESEGEAPPVDEQAPTEGEEEGTEIG